MTEKNSTDPEAPLAENVDYYMERGYLVFTEHYHLKRGYCCKNGCRHCPYRKKDEKNGQKPEK